MKTSTELLCMTDMNIYTCQSKILETYQQDGKYIIILDKTVFYPQGGGQPFDIGSIYKEGVRFCVEEVYFENGQVLHIGRLEYGDLVVGDTIECLVDIERRSLNTRLHSAGHVVDMAISLLGYDWKPLKGFHFPDGPYIEYEVRAEGVDIEELANTIERKSNEILESNLEVGINFDSSKHNSGKPNRIISFGDFRVPCGGTHVQSLKEIKKIIIRKIKHKKDRLKISYAI